MIKKRWVWILSIFGALLFFWLVILKILVRLPKKGSGNPCPYALSWIVDNPLRRWEVRHALRYAGLRSGETVLELGPGPGAFTLNAADLVGPQGKIIAVDVQPQMIEKVRARLLAHDVNNVETHVASGYELPIDNEQVDRAYLVTVLPEIPDPVRCLREIHRVLKPGGIVSLNRAGAAAIVI